MTYCRGRFQAHTQGVMRKIQLSGLYRVLSLAASFCLCDLSIHESSIESSQPSDLSHRLFQSFPDYVRGAVCQVARRNDTECEYWAMAASS